MKRSVITVCKLRRKDSTRLAFRSVEEERAERSSPFNPLMLAKKKHGCGELSELRHSQKEKEKNVQLSSVLLLLLKVDP